MLRARCSAVSPFGQRSLSTASRTPRSSSRSTPLLGPSLLFLALSGGAILLTTSRDELSMKSERPFAPTGDLNDGKSRENPLTFLWGRNTDLVVSPPPSTSSSSSSSTSSSSEFVKKPLSSPSLLSLGGVLRDLKLSRTYGVAIDLEGDVYQWGLGFNPSSSSSSSSLSPDGTGTETSASAGAIERTVTGKEMRVVEATEEGKVFGIDRKGEVWVWSSSKSLQSPRLREGTEQEGGKALWWLGQGTLWGGKKQDNAVDCLKLRTDSLLQKGEKFVSLSAGASHLLALTSHGRSFSLPLSLSANTFGQLGVRTVHLLTPRHPASAPTGWGLTVRLEPDERLNEVGRDKDRRIQPPKNLDPLLLNSATPPSRANPQPPSPTIPSLPSAYSQEEKERQPLVLHSSPSEHSLLERSIDFSTTLHEIPPLKGLFVKSLKAGRNHSLVLLGGKQDGRVLGFGAGNYGQLGLGPSLSYPSIPTPTEIPFLRSPAYSSLKPTSTKCLSIEAGGNLSYFVVETERPGKSLGSSLRREIDLLACGQGQFGGLGNGLWAHATHPLRVKTVSGLTEWNESLGRVEPISIKSISAGETHVAVVLDNAVTFPDGSKFGRDVFTFGSNEFYQLGNGKRASLATPQHLPPLPYPSSSSSSAALKPVLGPNGEKLPLISKDKKEEESLSSGTTSPMPHKRLQLATDLPLPPGLSKKSKNGGKTKVEETVITGDSMTGVYMRIVEEDQ
ncbi:uncharacterized protein JCM6883_002422 [Sporobolomyces salmoneus]|uniref:uncharacterized protein n=1 Tax=Sporobolomyces salmoneus TaxID=183962 RepID=UPI00317B5A93